ncbi:lysylphosphatidylglycerol synthase transmembrane domain-containing protein [Sphingobacterium sp. Mn56C]|uniref:lysylphosphatidylglycerol synthase transmembrane domain-containing protein n=1 Tax=Sphingobacterium sp. Mn56C TaxID=3395261 RepID=UPI003BBE74CE
MDKNKAFVIGKNIFKIIVTLAAIYWVSQKIQFNDIKNAIVHSNWLYLFLALLSYILSQMIASSRLNSFFKTIKLKLSEQYNLKLYALGLIYNFFLPGGIGGDAYKVYFLKRKHQVSTKQLLSAVFFDRLSGLWALAIVSCALIIFMPRFAIPNYLTMAGAIIGTASYVSILYLFFRPFAKRFLQTHFKALVVQGLQILSAIFILYALGHEDKFSPYLLTFLLSSVAAIIPSVGGAIGVRDAFAAMMATYLKIDEHLMVAVTLIFYTLTLITSLPGLYFIFRPSALGEDKLPSAAEVESEFDNETVEEEKYG